MGEGRVLLSGPSYPLSQESEYIPKDSAKLEGANNSRCRIGSAEGKSRPNAVTKTSSSSPYWSCKQLTRKSHKCATEFLIGLCNPTVSCNTYEKLCNGYLGGKDWSARLTGIPNMDS